MAAATLASSSALPIAVGAVSQDRTLQVSVAAAERPQPPRSHDGADRPAAIPGAGAAVGPPSAAGTRLHRHALESILAFLRRGELAFALRVSRHWLAAAHSMRSLQIKVPLPIVPLDVLAQSAMGHHVAAIGIGYRGLAVNTDSLRVLALQMPHLRELACTMPLAPTPAPLCFPAALRKLDLGVTNHPSPADVNAALQSISRLSLLEGLIFRLQSLDPLVSLAPLAALSQLRSLLIPRAQFSDAQVDELRALSWLEEIFIPMDTSLLRRLLRRPHSLQWRIISLPHPVDDEVAALLPSLPSLVKIDSVCSCSRFDWLRGLPNLTDVYLKLADPAVKGPIPHRTASLVAGLQSCSNIDILTFNGCSNLGAAHLAELLPRLPRLQNLRLYNLDIDSLGFLAQPPMTSQLSSLELFHCTQLPLSELHHVHSLRGLTRLMLNMCFDAPLSERDQSLCTPPSVILPHLQSFVYFPPPANHESESEDDEYSD